ncbi:S-phase kinase-associated protein 2 [Drosophila subpulchrella]|uniref:S-phase kinase-associated protein 2 n=1 Tax=Drosophila subpulchrella TaxID=1486046 RepID=UPI0018A1A9BE|nr:S-phase kinase-associated protein 2 [Drosophila subpulchrella]
MSGRKHRGSENMENLCPITRKRSASKNSASAVGALVSATKSSLNEHPSSPSALTFEALEEMGIGMLDSEESSSSALSAIALAVSASATSDDNSNETTPYVSVPRMVHQLHHPQRLSLGSSADTTQESIAVEEAMSLTRQSAEKLQTLAQSKRSALGSEGGSNSNSPSKRLRNPLAAVSCNNQSETAAMLNFQPSTSRLAQVRQAKKHSSTQITRIMPTDSFFVYRTPAMSAHISSGINYFERLSDEILLNIFKWLPKKTLLRMSTVCRRFNRCSRDETLWTRLDLGLRTIRPGALEQIVRRGVLVIRLAQASVQEPAFTPSSAGFRARLQYLDLSMASISRSSLRTLISHCRQLKKISLENIELDDSICTEIARNKALEAVNLTMASGLTTNSVRLMMQSLTNLSSLNISWTDLSADAVTALVTNISPNVIRLNIAGCRRVLFDSHVASLQKRCPQLLELDLSDCNSLTPAAITAIMKFRMLEYLSVSRCYLIPATRFIELKGMPSLTYLDIFGMLSDAAMEVLEKQMPKMGINKFIHSSVSRPTVGTRRTSIWGLRTRD